MYIPPAYREGRTEVLHEVIRRNSFGTLVARTAEGLVASHLPFLLDAGRGPHGTLIGHMARANTHWESFRDGAEALVIFQGPHAYISPSWYETELSVPTWNYVAVHAYGAPRVIEGASSLRGLLEAMVETYEAPLPEPWSVGRLPEAFVEKLARAIVGFEIPIERLEGKFKLSQNRSRADREGAVAGLEQQGDAQGAAIAALMAALGE